MLRRAFLIALVPALTFLAGCSKDDEPTFKPPTSITVIGNVNTTSTPNTFIALDNDRVGALGWTMQHGARYLVSYVRLKLAMDVGEGDSIVVALFRDSGRRAELAAAGRKYVQLHHDWQQLAQRLIDVYEDARTEYRRCA